MKKPSLKLLHKKAWKLISEFVRRCDYGICFTCGKRNPWKKMDCGHYIHKNCLDFDLINLHCQCTKCNRFLHGNLGIYAERLIAEYGERTINELRQRGNIIKKFTREELENIIALYKQRIRELS